MYISKIEKYQSNRYKVYSDNEYLFSLYGGEIKRYRLREGEELSDEQYQWILDNIIWKRAKERSLYLIERRPYTVSAIDRKLRDSGYPAYIVQKVIAFLQKYGYLDDYEYARMYIESYARKKSKKRIVFDLQNKGIEKEIVLQCMEALDVSDEDSLYLLVDKYVRGKDILDSAVRQKVIRYFYGKGYQYSQILSCLEKIPAEEKQ